MVSVGEKVSLRRDQLGARETSESEPLMRCRNINDGVKTGGHILPQDKSRGSLLTAWMASGIEVA